MMFNKFRVILTQMCVRACERQSQKMKTPDGAKSTLTHAHWMFCRDGDDV